MSIAMMEQVETLIVSGVVLLALAYAVRHLHRQWFRGRRENKCSACSHCAPKPPGGVKLTSLTIQGARVDSSTRPDIPPIVIPAQAGIQGNAQKP